MTPEDIKSYFVEYLNLPQSILLATPLIDKLNEQEIYRYKMALMNLFEAAEKPFPFTKTQEMELFPTISHVVNYLTA